MLGDSTLRQWYASADSLSVKPKVICEWNANDFSNIASFGHGNGVGTSVSNKTITYSYLSPSAGIQAKTTTPIYTATSLTGADNSYRLSFYAKSSFPIELTVVAQTTLANKVVNSSSKVITVYSAEGKWFSIDAFTRDPNTEITGISYTVYGSNQIANQDIVVNLTNINVYTVSKSETSKSLYTSIYDIFSSNRPGEPYVDSTLDSNTYQNVFPYHLAFYKFMNTSITSGISNNTSSIPLSKSRDILPNYRSQFNYYFYQYTGSAGSTIDNYVFAKYEKSFKANKIVIKFNAVRVLPSVKIAVFDGSSWNEVATSFSPDSNGLLVLYWNGSSWSKTKWSSTPVYNAETSIDSVTFSGIRVKMTTNGLNTGIYDEVHIAEISPRLELDLSQYVNAYNITKELSSDNYPTPVGVPNSNYASVEFNNIPSYNGTMPFSQYDSTHPLYGLMGKNVKIKIYADPFDKDASYAESPLGIFYSKSWKFNSIESLSVDAYDQIKNLSTTIAPVFYVKNTSPVKIISMILDNCGFTDYNYNELMALETDKKVSAKIPHFWTMLNDTVLKVIQSIALPYQIICYVDEYGIIRFNHLSNVNSSSLITEYSITDTNIVSGANTIKSNIINLSENQESPPSSLSIRYTDIQPYSYNEATANSATMKTQKFTDLWQPPVESLGFIKIAGFILSNTANSIKYVHDDQKSYIDSFSGYLLVNDEIIKYDGVEYQFTQTYAGTTPGTTVSQVYTHVVKSDAEVQQLRSNYLLDPTKTVFSVSATKIIGKLVTLRNLTRGCFGTPVRTHGLGETLALTAKLDTASSRASLSDAFSSTSDGINITKNSTANIERKVILYTPSSGNGALTNEYRIFSGTFSIPKHKLPSDGNLLEFGVACGSTNTNTKDGLFVGIKVGKKTVKGTATETTTYTEQVSIKQYSMGNTAVLDKTITINKSSDPDIDVSENKFGSYINFAGENNITVYLSNSDIAESATYDRAIILINGNVVSVGGGVETQVILKNGSNSASYFPAIKLGAKINLTDKYFGVYTNGKTDVNLLEMQSIGSVNDSASISNTNNLNLLSSVMYGNTRGISNKNEVDAVVFGQITNDYISSKGVQFRILGREIKMFDIEFNSYPVVFSKLYRNPYVLSYTEAGDSTIYKQVVPPESVTFSTYDASPITARFAMINSYTRPVVINGYNNDADVAQSVTFLKGSVLVPSQNGVVSTVINSNSIDGSDIKIESDWIQSRIDASAVLDTISKYAIMKRANIEVELFGNPLITVGDILSVSYSLMDLDGKYMVVAARQSFDNGINTSVTLRRIEK